MGAQQTEKRVFALWLWAHARNLYRHRLPRVSRSGVGPLSTYGTFPQAPSRNLTRTPRVAQSAIVTLSPSLSNRIPAYGRDSGKLRVLLTKRSTCRTSMELRLATGGTVLPAGTSCPCNVTNSALFFHLGFKVKCAAATSERRPSGDDDFAFLPSKPLYVAPSAAPHLSSADRPPSPRGIVAFERSRDNQETNEDR